MFRQPSSSRNRRWSRRFRRHPVERVAARPLPTTARSRGSRSRGDSAEARGVPYQFRVLGLALFQRDRQERQLPDRRPRERRGAARGCGTSGRSTHRSSCRPHPMLPTRPTRSPASYHGSRLRMLSAEPPECHVASPAIGTLSRPLGVARHGSTSRRGNERHWHTWIGLIPVGRRTPSAAHGGRRRASRPPFRRS